VAYEFGMDRCEMHWAGTVQSDPSISTFECWLKNAPPAPPAPSAPAPAFTRLVGPCRTQSGGPGNYIGVPGVDARGCEERCAEDAACVAYEFGLDRCEIHSSGAVTSDPSISTFHCWLKGTARAESVLYTKATATARGLFAGIWRHKGSRLQRRRAAALLSHDAILLQADVSKALAADLRGEAAEL